MEVEAFAEVVVVHVPVPVPVRDARVRVQEEDGKYLRKPTNLSIAVKKVIS